MRHLRRSAAYTARAASRMADLFLEDIEQRLWRIGNWVLYTIALWWMLLY